VKAPSGLSVQFAKTVSSLTREPTRAVPELRRRMESAQKALAPGVIAGIVIGAIVGAITILLVGFWILRKKKRRKNQSQARTASASGNAVHEMEDQDNVLSRRKWFLKRHWRNEVQGSVDPQELDSKNVRLVPGPPVELEASEAGHGDVPIDQSGRAGRV
jgi:hypothetical protein